MAGCGGIRLVVGCGCAGKVASLFHGHDESLSCVKQYGCGGHWRVWMGIGMGVSGRGIHKKLKEKTIMKE